MSAFEAPIRPKAIELKAMDGSSMKRSSKKKTKSSSKRPKRLKASDAKYSLMEVLRLNERNRPARPKKLNIPDLEDDKEELLRLMTRSRPTVEEEKEYLYEDGCPICSKDHTYIDCPCLDRIPPGTILGPTYDMVCNCCGKIGHVCCPKGAYAILIRCSACGHKDHWYWENGCPKEWCKPSYLVEIPSIQELQHEVMQNKNKDVVKEDNNSDSEDEHDYDNFYDVKGRLKKLKIPDFEDDKEELLRLMKRIRPAVEEDMEYLYEDGCPICSEDHIYKDCPCLDRIPPGTNLGPLYDTVCNCCGKIGDLCCSKGAYAILIRCSACGNKGHWYWDNGCPKEWCKPSYLVEIPSIEELEYEVMKNKNKDVVTEDEKNSIKEAQSAAQSLKNSLQNKEKDEVMVDVGKDSKNKDEVMVEDHDSKEDDEVKGVLDVGKDNKNKVMVEDDDSKEDEGGKESPNQNRGEKKNRKAMLKLGMEQVTGFNMISNDRTTENLCSISKPNVFKSPYYDTLGIFGEAKIEELFSQQQTQIAQQLRMPDMSPVMAKLEISGAKAGALQMKRKFRRPQ